MSSMGVRRRGRSITISLALSVVAAQTTAAATNRLLTDETPKRAVAGRRAEPPAIVTPDIRLGAVSKTLLASVDPVNGGFGDPRSGPKSLHAPALDALLAAATRNRDTAAQRALVKALEAMAYGGIHDQLGGGFHRGTIDPAWTIPHFEKRLVDNAQLLSLYVRSYPPTRVSYLRDVAIDIATYLLRDMQAPGGGFYASQGAATDGLDGRVYLWTRGDIEQELDTRDAVRIFAVYAIAPLPDTKVGGVLHVRLPIDERVQSIGATDSVSMLNAVAGLRADLLERRMSRPQPPIDKTIVTGLNGLTIAALAQAGTELDRPEFTDAALAAADTMWSEGFDSTKRLLKHTIVDGRGEVDGALADYAMLAGGFVDLAEATQDDAWRVRAGKLADAMLERFATPDRNLVRGEDDGDEDAPAGPSAALDLLLRLGSTPDGSRFRTAAARLATAISGRIAARPSAWPSAVAALARHPISDEVDVAAPR